MSESGRMKREEKKGEVLRTKTDFMESCTLSQATSLLSFAMTGPDAGLSYIDRNPRTCYRILRFFWVHLVIAVGKQLRPVRTSESYYIG